MERQNTKQRRILQRLSTRGNESGAALYLMLVFTALMSVQLMSAQLTSQQIQHETKRQHRLKFAKENLIALATNYMHNYGPTGAGPGHLPCANQKIPNSNRSSQGPDTPCVADHFVIGRLPRLVGVEYQQRVLNYQPDQYDAENALWYVVATNFANSPFRKLNTNSESNLSFNRQEDVVAVLFDSGPANNTQRAMRPSSEFDDYLELDINGADILLKDSSNDRYLVITLKQILPLIAAQVSGKAAEWLRQYHDRRCPTDETVEHCFPYASELPDGSCSEGTFDGWLAISVGSCADALFESTTIEDAEDWMHWFKRNQWYEVVRYELDEGCLASGSDCEVISDVVLFDERIHPMISIAPRVEVIDTL